MATQSCTVIGQAYGTQGSSISYSTTQAAYAGWSYSTYYPYILKITTPDFSGISSALVFSLSILRGKRDWSYSTECGLQWALCASDANFAMYDDTWAEVVEDNQLATGTITFDSLTDAYTAQTLTIPATGLQSNTSYYLILWAYNPKSQYDMEYCTLNTAANHSVVLECAQGLVYIDNGTSWDAYEVYIDNGTSWDKYIPYIDDGTSWNLCG